MFGDIKKFLNEKPPVHGLEFLLDFSLLAQVGFAFLFDATPF